MLRPDGELEALRMLCDRREELTRLRVQTLNRLQRLLAELVPGQAKRDLTAVEPAGAYRSVACAAQRGALGLLCLTLNARARRGRVPSILVLGRRWYRLDHVELVVRAQVARSSGRLPR